MTDLAKIIFKTQIVEIGKDAYEMLENNVLVLFEQDAPELLKDICFMHTSKELRENIIAGDCIEIGSELYNVACVGNVACTTLSSMGHCSLIFGEVKASEVLPGSVYLKERKVPTVGVGTCLKVIRYN
ncbi:MAG: sorbitol transporter subunit [Clostridiaceae bacterium]|jgi:PTS system glucitol/sorbitol-specific IIA component|nr:sorbitol transporter subunit [Clostridiaceae bacterium]